MMPGPPNGRSQRHADDHGAPSRADALKNRASILAAARTLFAHHSVDDVSMTAVAQEAGVGKGTLYRNFADKAALCMALLDEDQRHFQARTLAHMAATPDACAALHWFLAELVGFVLRNEDLLRAQVGVQSLGHPAHAWWRQTIVSLLRRTGAFDDAEVLAAAANALYVLADIHALTYQARVLGYDEPRIVRGFARLLERLVESC